jgi:hypothetical protein
LNNFSSLHQHIDGSKNPQLQAMGGLYCSVDNKQRGFFSSDHTAYKRKFTLGDSVRQ